MVDSLPPSGTDPDNQTIITNSNSKLQVIQPIGYLADFDQDSGDWTGIDSVEDGIAKVNVPEAQLEYASVTADLTNIDALTFRIDPGRGIAIFFDGVKEGGIDGSEGSFQTLEIRGLNYGTNTTVKIEGGGYYPAETFRIDYVRSNIIQPESRKIELVDTGGL